jgi:hypothetical protein
LTANHDGHLEGKFATELLNCLGQPLPLLASLDIVLVGLVEDLGGLEGGERGHALSLGKGAGAPQGLDTRPVNLRRLHDAGGKEYGWSCCESKTMKRRQRKKKRKNYMFLWFRVAAALSEDGSRRRLL